MISALVLGVGLTVGATAIHSAHAWPEPEKPIVVASRDLDLKDYEDLDQAMTLAGYTIAGVRQDGGVVPRVFAAAMPDDMAAITSPDERKRIFIKLMLPLVLDANERLLADRAHLTRVMALQGAGMPLSAADRSWLDDMYALYEVEPGDDRELLTRVDVIPPSLALAQAAQETGWGTSRFVHEGNALFGQRIWKTGAGMVPEDRDADENHEVRSFDGLKASVLAYMVNLNRHPAYDGFRDLRAMLRRGDRPLDPFVLAGGLARYSEEGRDYIEKIRTIIRTNELTDFDLARLADVRI